MIIYNLSHTYLLNLFPQSLNFDFLIWSLWKWNQLESGFDSIVSNSKIPILSQSHKCMFFIIIFLRPYLMHSPKSFFFFFLRYHNPKSWKGRHSNKDRAFFVFIFHFVIDSSESAKLIGHDHMNLERRCWSVLLRLGYIGGREKIRTRVWIM